MEDLYQSAPWPAELEDLVEHCRLWPGWSVRLYGDYVRDPADTHSGEARGATLVITTKGPDTHHPERGENYRVDHIFGVPAATYNRTAWQRWLFERYCDVWLHEAMESFAIVYTGSFRKRDGTLSDTYTERPYAATHKPGTDPYVVHEYATDEERRTNFRGELNPE